MDARGYQQYKQQSINSMTPGELLLLLYDELVKRSTLASIALDKQDWPTFGAVHRHRQLPGRDSGPPVPHQSGPGPDV